MQALPTAKRASVVLRRVITWALVLAVFVVTLGSALPAVAFGDATGSKQISVAGLALSSAADEADTNKALGSGCVLRHLGSCMQQQAPIPDIACMARTGAVCEAITWPLRDSRLASSAVAPPSEPPRA